MLVLAARVPVQLSPRQAALVVALAAVVLLGVLARGLIEAVLIAAVALLLRLTGHPPPRRSSLDIQLDELEQRLRAKKDE